MTWLFEEPWTIIIWGTIVEIGLGIALYTTGLGKYLYWMLAAAGVIGGLLLVERLVVTEREKVQIALYAAADAVERGDTEAVLRHISSGKPALRERVRSELARYRVTSVSIKNDLKITLNELMSPPEARVEFHVVVTGGEKRGGFSEMSVPLAFVVQFQRDPDGWMIAGYDDRGVSASLR